MRKSPWTGALWALACLVVLFASTARAGDGKWQWLEEKRGIRLWKLEVPGQQLPGFRGFTEMHASLDEIVKQMLDVKHHTEWMHRCAESWIYQMTGPTSAILYNRTSSAPWPVWDRDVVLDVRLEYNADHTEVMAQFHNLDDKLRPVPERVVRMPRLVGFYKLVQVAPKRTQVLYQVEADIGGSVPQWIADVVAEDLPFYTLLSLRERVEDRRSETAPATPVAVDVPAPKAREELQATAH